MKKNDICTGICIDYTHEGSGVVKADNFVFFIKNVLVNEEVEFVITKLNAHYGYGKVQKILKPSLHRVEPFCCYYGKCGGCQLQHMSYEEQLRFKTNIVRNNMEKIAGLNVPILETIGCEQIMNYRNKAQFPVCINENGVQIGFYRVHSNDIIDMNECAIQSELINKIMKKCKEILKTLSFHNDFRHILVKHSFYTNEVMVVVVTKKRYVNGLNHFVNQLTDAFSEIKSVVQNINKRNDNVILADEEVVLYGKGMIMDCIKDLKFMISSKSFYQVNPMQTQVLYDKALEFAELTKDDVVIDLYCGVGTISLCMAKQAKKVIGIEIVEAAIENAKTNAALNQIDNVEFVCSDAAKYANKLAKEDMKPNVIVVDPPRKGCDSVTLESMCAMNPERIVYVSCNPATLARDIKKLNNEGYQVEKVQPCDMFPNSYHVETIVRLSRVKLADKYR